MIDLIDSHTHSHFSMLDGVSSPTEIVTRAKSWGATAIALTDHGTIAGWYEFYATCKKQGLKPLLGCELYFKEKLQDKNKEMKYMHGIFIAMNLIGYRNLMELSSIGGKPDHFEFNRPVVSIQDIFDHSEGLIYSTGCLDGIMGTSHSFPYEQVDNLVSRFKDVFKDRMYVEVGPARIFTRWDWKDETHKEKFHKPIEKTLHKFGDDEFETDCLQEQHNRRALHMALKYELPLIVGSDAHMITPNLKPIQDLLIKSSMTNHDGWHFGQIHSLLTSEEMWAQFEKNHPYLPKEAFEYIISNNQKLADQVENFELDFPTLVPKFPLHIHPLHQPNMTARELMLAIIADIGRLDNKEPKYLERLAEEIKVICDNGVVDFTDYFLILHDVVRFAKEKNIGTGPARGSAGGCLLSYLLGITHIDPIVHNLSFTRFLNRGRLGEPDIDFTKWCGKI